MAWWFCTTRQSIKWKLKISLGEVLKLTSERDSVVNFISSNKVPPSLPPLRIAHFIYPRLSLPLVAAQRKQSEFSREFINYQRLIKVARIIYVYACALWSFELLLYNTCVTNSLQYATQIYFFFFGYFFMS